MSRALVYEEPLFRPPSEARSLILQLTIGCSWNRCTYCGMYRNKQFQVRPAADLRAEIRNVAALAGAEGIRRVFLADGDALAAPADLLALVLGEIKKQLPSVRRVGLYGDSRSILRLGPQILANLRELGLGIIYFGAESGDDQTLHQIRKGATAARQVAASQAARAAGIKVSIMVLLGLAGVAGSDRHATATGEFLVAAQPTYGSALTLTVVPGTEIFAAQQAGTFRLPDRWGMLAELANMLEAMEGFSGPFFANHASNYLPLKLRLPRDRQPTVTRIRDLLATSDDSCLTPEWARGL